MLKIIKYQSGLLYKYAFFAFFLLLIYPTVNSAQIFTSPEADKKSGKEMSEQVANEIGLYHNEAMKQYLNEIGARLIEVADNKDFDFHFDIVDQQEPNAFALPGGYIYFSRGLLPLANSEAELAAVMGHEMVHVIKRHSAKQSERGIIPGLLSLPGVLVGTFVNKDLGALLVAPVALVSGVTLASYSRKQEKDADILGMKLAAKAGYDPKELAVILQQIENDVQMVTGQKRKFSFFDDHPTTPDREKTIKKESAGIEWKHRPPVAKNHRDFLKHMDGIIYGVNPSQGIFRKQQFLHPVLGFSITFPKGWKQQNTPTAVGAITEKQDGGIFIDGVGKAEDPVKLGKAFVKKLKEQHKVTPHKAEEVFLHSYPGYLVTLIDKSGGHTVYYYYLWITMNDMTYHLIGGGLNKYYNDLKNTVYSLRPLTNDEKNSITVDRVRLVEALDGETIAQLCLRTNNIWSPAYTAMVNSLQENDKLSNGQLIKIIKREKFTK